MAVIKKIEMKCDLCGTTKTVAEGYTPKDWVIVGLENPFVERDFYDRHVCDRCAKIIALNVGKTEV